MKTLIAGAKGQLGQDLTAAGRDAGWDAVGIDLPECDITHADDLRRAFQQGAPYEVVINAAAYTAVDQAESDKDTAFAVNCDAVGHLASLCSEYETPLIHVSTDYVFDGTQTCPYRPSDSVSPLGVYGQSKAAGEDILRSRLQQHIIIRTSWLYGVHGNNFVKTMLHHGMQRDELRVVDDQVGCPTYAYDLAVAIVQIAQSIAGGNCSWGTYHYCNEGAVTWYAFARKIFALARLYDQFKVQDIIPILSHHYPTPTPRPHYSVLDCSTIEDIFGISRRNWDDALREMLAQFYSTTE
jgi:dTDP-4-dehydrorhamnose reductase